MADGYVMTIPKSVLEKLDLADKKIKDIADSSEKTQKRVVTAFQNMANGIDPLLQKLGVLKAFGNFKLDTTFKNSATAAEKTANSVAQVATQLNRIAESPLGIIERNLSLFRATVMDTSEKVSKLQTNITGMLSASSKTQTPNTQMPTVSDTGQVKALQLQRSELQQNEKYWKRYIDNLTGSSIASQRQKAEMDKLNSSFRNGSSLLQKQAKAEDEFGKAVKNVVTSLDKAAKAEQRKKAIRSNKEAQVAARAEEQYARALAKTEVTIIQRTRKIEALANAQRALNATGRNYSQQISTITSETQRLQAANANAVRSTQKLGKEQSNILNTTEQLKRQFALLFSISAIKGYMSQLIAVRGEFELQQRALQSILQNKDQANEIWNKTVQLAVRSPFTVKELVTYTKQLAAYRIEADKLYDTNKILADVSAGLGVSMDRLLLAFGQVKAANYLRASEVRQFTEAGVNILGELAAIYTELEGKMVSVGDVQERITKRMVKFGDVEEVFKRITAAGGIFYNMQEVQAETLAGMMSNLRDTFDLMFNEIGKANDGILKTFVTLLKDIVNSWETIGQIVIPIISTLAGRFVLLKTAQMSLSGGALSRMFKITLGGFQMMGAKLTNNIRLTTVLTQRMKMLGTTSLGGWTAALGLVAMAVWEVYNALSAAKKQQEELNKIATEGSFDASKSVAEYKRLADIVSDATKSYEEQKEALDTLKRTYGNILPAHMLEIDAIRQMKGNYDEATKSIYNYIAAKTQEKQIQYIAEKYGEEVNERGNDLANQIKDNIESLTGVAPKLAEILPIITELQEGIKSGEINIKNIDKAIENLSKKYLGQTLKGLGSSYLGGFDTDLLKKLGKYYNSVIEYNEQIQNIEASTLKFGSLVERQMAEATKEIDNMTNDAKKSLDILSKSKDNRLISKEQVDEAKRIVIGYFEWVGKQVDEKELNDKLNNIIGGDIISLQDLVKQMDIASLDDKVVRLTKQFGSEAIPYIERLEKTLAGKESTTFQKKIHDIVVAYAKENKMSLNGLDKALAETEENSLKYLPRIKQEYKDLSEDIKRVTFAKSPDFGTVSPEKLQEMKNLAKVYKKIIDSYPETDKEQRQGESEAEKRLKKQLALLKEIGKAYKDNQKYYNKQDSAVKTKLDYKDVAREAGIEDLVMTMSLEPSGLINGISEIGKQASSKMKLEVEKAIAGIRGEIDIDVRVQDVKNVQDEIGKVLSDYELTVSMGKAFPAIDREDLGKLFNFDTYTLEEAQNKINQLWIDKANERERIVAASEGRIARTYETGFAAAASLGEKGVSRYNDNMKKITDAQSKELETRLKRFGEYINKSLDLQRAVQQEANQDLLQAGELFQKGMINAQQYATIVKNVTDEANSKIGKINIDKFKDSPDYIKMIGDTSQYSKRELQELLDKMQEFISLNAGNMDSQQLKSLMDDMDKIRKSMDEIDEKNPFNQSLFAQLKKMKQARKEYNEELEKNKRLAKEAAQAEKELAEAQARAKQTQAQHSTSVDASSKDEIAAAGEEVNVATENLDKANGALKQSNGALGQAGAKLKGIEGKMGGALGMVDKIVTGIYQGINAAIDVMNQFKDLAESTGIDTSKGGWREVAQAGEVLGNVNERVMSSWNNFKSGNYAGAAADAIGSITTIFTTLNKQHDARREQDIQDEIKMVNRLSMAYEHLARKIENAYTIDTLNMGYENAKRNLEQQIASTQKMIAAEQDKKDQDDERIAEWQDQLIQYEEQLEDLRNQKLQGLGGFGSGSAMADAASEFASAWMEAYMETGDGLDALNDKWDEFIQNIVVKQLALRGVSKFLEPIMKQIDAAIGNDSYLSTDELAKIKASVEEMNPKLNAYFKDIMEGFGDLLPQPGSGSESSGLQKGIQSVTEETANIIEAYLNSMRYFVADSNMILNNFYAAFISIDPLQNPMYSELSNQTRLLRSIDDRLSSVITYSGDHPSGGASIKVLT